MQHVLPKTQGYEKEFLTDITTVPRNHASQIFWGGDLWPVTLNPIPITVPYYWALVLQHAISLLLPWDEMARVTFPFNQHGAKVEDPLNKIHIIFICNIWHTWGLKTLRCIEQSLEDKSCMWLFLIFHELFSSFYVPQHPDRKKHSPDKVTELKNICGTGLGSLLPSGIKRWVGIFSHIFLLLFCVCEFISHSSQ